MSEKTAGPRTADRRDAYPPPAHEFPTLLVQTTVSFFIQAPLMLGLLTTYVEYTGGIGVLVFPWAIPVGVNVLVFTFGLPIRLIPAIRRRWLALGPLPLWVALAGALAATVGWWSLAHGGLWMPIPTSAFFAGWVLVCFGIVHTWPPRYWARRRRPVA